MIYQKLFEINKIIKQATLKANNKKNNLFFFSDNNKINDLNQVIKKLPKYSNVIFRDYNLNYHDKCKEIKKILPIVKCRKINLIIAKDFNLFLRFKAQGLHFSDRNRDISCLKLMLMKQFCQKQKKFFSFAIHDFKKLNLVKKIQPNIVFYSPIFATSSHQNQRPFGLFNFIKISKILAFYQIKILPLGGIYLQNLRRLNKFRLEGFGAIDFFKNL